jgi:hypothetical protein
MSGASVVRLTMRTSRRGMVARSRPDFALSCPFFSRPVSRQNFEVRKHKNFACYKSGAYSLTFQAVGWRHCLPRRKSPTRARRHVRLSEFDGYYQLDVRVRRRQPDPAGPIAIGLLPLWVRPVGDESAASVYSPLDAPRPRRQQTRIGNPAAAHGRHHHHSSDYRSPARHLQWVSRFKRPPTTTEWPTRLPGHRWDCAHRCAGRY